MVKFAAPALVWERFPGNLAGGTAGVRRPRGERLAAGGRGEPDRAERARVQRRQRQQHGAGERGGRPHGWVVRVPARVGDREQLRRRAPVLVERRHGDRLAGQPRAGHGPVVLLANRFHDHLRSLGFDAAAGAFEGVDRLELNTFDGASSGPDSTHINNAYMCTPPDGFSPLMQMYLLRNPNYRNGNCGDDAAILYHEYTHGLSNRLVMDAGGVGALYSPQAGAMGEGVERLVRAGLPRRPVPGAGYRGLGRGRHGRVLALRGRRGGCDQPLDCPRSPPTRSAARDGRCPGAAATPTVTSGGSSAGRRCTPTARSGPRRCGTCARRSARRRRAALSPPAWRSRRWSRRCSTRATRS